MRHIVIERYGDPEVMQLSEQRTPEPGPGQVRVRVAAAGVNFIDVYQRTGRYPGSLPYTPGSEGAGTVDALGPGVSSVQIGARMAWAGVPGSYASHVLAPPDKLVPVPPGVGFEEAAAVMLQGMTAHYLCVSTFPVRDGQTVLVHAGAGGVGLLLTQLARQRGARVLTTVSTSEKEQLSRSAGASDVIRYTEVDFEKEVMRLTENAGVDVVYDSVGKSTFEKGLKVLKPLGTMVLFGGSSGPVAPVDPMVLNHQGSLFLTRPKLGDYVPDRPALLQRATDILKAVESHQLSVRIHARYPLHEAVRAHRALESRETTGKLLLLPS